MCETSALLAARKITRRITSAINGTNQCVHNKDNTFMVHTSLNPGNVRHVQTEQTLAKRLCMFQTFLGLNCGIIFIFAWASSLTRYAGLCAWVCMTARVGLLIMTHSFYPKRSFSPPHLVHDLTSIWGESPGRLVCVCNTHRYTSTLLENTFFESKSKLLLQILRSQTVFMRSSKREFKWQK